MNQAVTDFTGYTSESVTAYKVALDNAKEVLTNEDATAITIISAPLTALFKSFVISIVSGMIRL